MNASVIHNRQHHPPSPSDVVIFGAGACARKIAANLNDCGISSCLAAGELSAPSTGDQGHLNWLVSAELIRCRGAAGGFELQFRRDGEIITKRAPAIVLAQDDRRLPNFEPYGLTPGPRIMTISALEKHLRRDSGGTPFKSGANLVFLCGWQVDSHPSVARRMLDGCQRVQRHAGLKTYFMTGNLNVAADGAEAAVQEAKRAGSVFLKFTEDYPTIRGKTDGRFVIDYADELTRMAFQLEADWFIVDETSQPTRGLQALAQQLAVDWDGAGFAQTDNVRRMSNATNRRGVFVAGGSRAILSDVEKLIDADQVSLRVLAFLQDLDAEDRPAAVIQEGRCARCLTCFRLCPHMAIDIGDHISVINDACQRCGLCVAGCPARAIEMEGVEISAEIASLVEPSQQATAVTQGKPSILVFGCARSAGQAIATVRQTGHDLPTGVQVIEVPCGGAIAAHHLLNAFDVGADGVMVCTCHNGNCQAEIGNHVAHRRAHTVTDVLTASGLNRDRLHIATVAANMGHELIRMIRKFGQQIDALNGS